MKSAVTFLLTFIFALQVSFGAVKKLNDQGVVNGTNGFSGLSYEQKRAEALAFLNLFPKLRILAPYTAGRGGMGMAIAVLDSLEELGFQKPIELIVPSSEHYELLCSLFPSLDMSHPKRRFLPGYPQVEIIPTWLEGIVLEPVDFAIRPTRDERSFGDATKAFYNLQLTPPYWSKVGIFMGSTIQQQFEDEISRMGLPSVRFTIQQSKEHINQLITDPWRRQILERYLDHREDFHRGVLYGFHFPSYSKKLPVYLKSLVDANLSKKSVLFMLSPLTQREWQLIYIENEKRNISDKIKIISEGDSLSSAMEDPRVQVVVVDIGLIPRKILNALLLESDLINTSEGTGVSQDARMLGVPYIPIANWNEDYLRAFKNFFERAGAQDLGARMLMAAEPVIDSELSSPVLTQLIREIVDPKNDVRSVVKNAGEIEARNNMLVEGLLRAKAQIIEGMQIKGSSYDVSGLITTCLKRLVSIFKKNPPKQSYLRYLPPKKL